MTLDRSIALIFLLLCAVYCYTAFVSMEASLLPFERNMSFLPNTMPKWLGVLGVITALVVVINTGPGDAHKPGDGDIDYRRLKDYKLGQALLLVAAMVAYALLLRYLGFIASTSLFLAGGSFILGERNWALMLPVSLIAAFSIWYLVQEVLGIFLRPWPFFLG
ncbi:MAG: tripartite tricarboxylate transporter TctB family protein [Granulosicoccaceae bacterium]